MPPHWLKIALFALCAVAGISLGGGQNALLIVMMAIVFGLVFLLDPFLALGGVIVAVFSLDWVAGTLGLPPSISWLQEVALAALLARMVTQRDVRSRRVVLGLLTLSLVAFAIVSAVGNLESPLVAVLGIRSLFKFIILFFAVQKIPLEAFQRRRLMQLVTVLVFIQVPVALAQRTLSGLSSGDIVGGTLGVYSSGTLTILLTAFMVIVTGWYMRGVLTRGRWFWSYGALFLPIALNETKVAFYILPLAMLLMVMENKELRVSRRLQVALVTLVLLAGVFSMYQELYPTSGAAKFLSREYVVNYLTAQYREGGGLNRVPVALFAVEEVSRSPVTAVFGFGPGSASRSVFEGGVGSVYKEFADYRVDTTFASRGVLELGLGGILLYLAVLFLLARENVRAARELTDPYWQAVAVGAVAMISLLVALAVYTTTLALDVLTCMMWLWSGLVFAERAERAEAQEVLSIPPARSAESRTSALPGPPSPFEETRHEPA